MFKYLKVLGTSEWRVRWTAIWCINSSNAAVVRDHSGVKEAEQKLRQSSRFISQSMFQPSLQSLAFGSDRKNEITSTSGPNEFPLYGGWIVSVRSLNKEL